MANLWTGTYEGKTYTSLETLSSLTFTNDTVYTIQILGTGYLREGENGKGVLIKTSNPIQYKHRGNTLYVGETFGTIEINIAD